MRKLLIILMLVLSFVVCAAEENNTKVPLKAAALSLCVPGGGQIYNESYLKGGVVVAVETALIGLTVYHHNKAESYYDDYRVSESMTDYNNYAKYFDKRQSDFFWLGTFVFLSTLDAYVDAHLFDYEAKKNKVRLKFEENSVSLSYQF